VVFTLRAPPRVNGCDMVKNRDREHVFVQTQHLTLVAHAVLSDRVFG
jgi:hypothetical protein